MENEDVWMELRLRCTELRSSRATEQKSAIKKLDAFLTVSTQECLHQWDSWPMLLNHLLHLVKLDLKGAFSSKKKLPKVEFVQKLRSVLKMSQSRGPKLHLTSQGIDFLKKMRIQCVEVLENRAYANILAVEMFDILHIVCSNRLYCSLAGEAELQSLLSVALNGMEGHEALSIPLLVSLFQSSNLDLFADMEEYTDSFARYFDSAETADTASAFKLLEGVNSLVSSYQGSILPFLFREGEGVLDPGASILRFVRRTWAKGWTNARQLKPQGAYYIKLYTCLLSTQNRLDSQRMTFSHPRISELLKMRDMLTDEIDRMLFRTCGIKNWVHPTLFAKNESAVLAITMMADVITSLSVIANQGNISMKDSRKRKRSGHVHGWDFIVEQLLNRLSSTKQQRSAHKRTTTTLSSTQYSQSIQQVSRGTNVISWMAIVVAFIMRNPSCDASVLPSASQCYDLLTILVENMVPINESVSVFDCWVLELIAILGNRSSLFCPRPEQLFSTLWIKVWQKLLSPEQPYGRAALVCGPGSSGESVVHLLNVLLVNRLVPYEQVLADQDLFWQFPGFRCPPTDRYSSEKVLYLMYSYPSNVEIVDGKDEICSSVVSDGVDDCDTSSRSKRLIQFVLAAMEMASLGSGYSTSDFASTATLTLATVLSKTKHGECHYRPFRLVFSKFASTMASGAVKSDEGSLEQLVGVSAESIEGFGVDFFLRNWGSTKETNFINDRISSSLNNDKLLKAYMVFKPDHVSDWENLVSSSEFASPTSLHVALHLQLLGALKQRLDLAASTLQRNASDYVNSFMRYLGYVFIISHFYVFTESDVAKESRGRRRKDQTSIIKEKLIKECIRVIAAELEHVCLNCQSEFAVSVLFQVNSILAVLQGRNKQKFIETGSTFPMIYATEWEAEVNSVAMSITRVLNTLRDRAGTETFADNTSSSASQPRWSEPTSRAFSQSHKQRSQDLDLDMLDGEDQNVDTTNGNPGMQNNSESVVVAQSKEMLELTVLWSLRILVSLQPEADVVSYFGCCVDDLEFLQGDSLLAIALMLTRIPGSESRDFILNILQHVIKENPTHVSLQCEVLLVLRSLGENYLMREFGFDPEVYFDSEVLQLILKFINRMHQRLRLYRGARFRQIQCLNVYFALEPDAFPALIEYVIGSAQDADLYVRLIGCSNLPLLFETFSDDAHDQIYDQIKQSLPKQKKGSDTSCNSAMLHTTSMLSLLMCASASEYIRASVVIKMLKFGKNESQKHSLLTSLARFLGYVNAENYLEEHFVTLLSWWIARTSDPEEHAWADLLKPFRTSDLSNLYASHYENCVPLLVMSELMVESNLVEDFHRRISSTAKFNASEFTLKYAPQLVITMLLFSQDGAEDNRNMIPHLNNFTMQSISKNDLLELVKSNMQKVLHTLLHHLIHLYIVNDTVLLKPAVHSIEMMYAKLEDCKVFVADLFLGIHHQYSTVKHLITRRRALRVFAQAISVFKALIIADTSSHSIMVHFACSYCLNATSDLIYDTLSMMKASCNILLKKTEIIGPYLNRIVSTLCKRLVVAKDSQKPQNDDVVKKLIGILESISNAVAGNVEGFEKYIVKLDPLPTDLHISIDRLNSLRHKLKEHLPDSHIVQDFIERLSHRQDQQDLEETKVARLEQVAQSLRNLREMGSDCIQKFYCQLVHGILSSYTDISEPVAVRLAAANCLGELGSSNLFSENLLLEGNPAQQSVLGQVEYADILSHAKSGLFVVSLKHLYDADAQVVLETLKCIRKLVLSDDFESALHTCNDEGTKRILCSYYSILSTEKDCFSNEPEEELDAVGNWLSGNLEFTKWIQSISSRLASQFAPGSAFEAFSSLCLLKKDVAVYIFPFLIFALLNGDDFTLVKVISQNFTEILNSKEVPKETKQIVLNSINFVLDSERKRFMELRKQKGRATAAAPRLKLYTYLVKVHALDVAEAALECHMPCTAIQMVEYFLERNDVVLTMKSRYEKILIEANRKLNDPDGIFGISSDASSQSLLTMYEHEGKWNKCLPLFDVLMLRQESCQEGFAKCLRMLGYHGLLGGFLDRAVDSASPQLLEEKYEQAWRNQQWDLELPNSNISDHESDSTPFHAAIHSEICSLRVMEQLTFEKTDKETKVSILNDLQLELQGKESTKGVFSALKKLQFLKGIHDVMTINASSTSGHVKRQQKFASLEKIWDHRRLQLEGDFNTTEQLLALETVLLDESSELTCLSKSLFRLARMARKENRSSIANSKLNILEKRDNLLFDPRICRFERAKLLWTQGECKLAMDMTTALRLELSESNPLLFSAVCRTIGEWSASQRSESSDEIINQGLKKATKILKVSNELLASCPSKEVESESVKAHFALANYMADLYQKVDTRVKSREWLSGKKVAMARQRELEQCKRMPRAKQKEHRIHITTLETEVQNDEVERSRVEESVGEFLCGALESYGKCLQISSRNNDLATVVFRILSLWFTNLSNPRVQSLMARLVDSIPSLHFVRLSYQIFSRIGTANAPSGFNKALEALVFKLCVEHPHHCLIQLLSLRNGDSVEGRGAAAYLNNLDQSKIEAAERLLKKLQRSSSSRLKPLIDSMELLSNAYIQLALFDTKEYHNRPRSNQGAIYFSEISLSFDTCLRDASLRTGTRAVMPAVITNTFLPRADCQYDDVVRVSSFAPSFAITQTGIHRPKIIYCIASDGSRIRQLVKGRDDTRQDVVIQQVFENVNSFLTDNENTRSRRLRLRTYKVVPLSPVAGVLEWVENTISYGEYLVASSSKRLSAHERYNPQDWTSSKCREVLKGAKSKEEAYIAIEAHFSPVFHHFFLETIPTPASWLERRKAYTRSVAVSSIVGHILGIGDRHSQNILLDTTTAELVHIDFGVVFDQGMALMTPETVPFRLTRDMVDGMGVSGVDGIFNRCCEETMKVMRNKASSLTTILEVFMHDPLYRWKLSPLKALRMQQEAVAEHHTTASTQGDGDLDSGSDAAARALLRIKQKLQGYEDPNGNAMSVEGQVKQLITAAQDPRNLCRLFPGWAPWI